MELKSSQVVDIPWSLIEGIKTFPIQREVEHCSTTFQVPPFDFYAQCPHCGTKIKVRACSGVTEIEDIFDAVFEWLNQPGAAELAHQRQQVIAADTDSDD
jgi:hypothetical protein